MMKKEAAKILVEARESKNLTQEEMAQQLAIALEQTYTRRQYQKLEEGRFPKYKTKIVKTLDVLLGTKLYSFIYEQEVHDSSLIMASKIQAEANKAQSDANLINSKNIEDLIALIKSKSATDKLSKQDAGSSI